MPPNDAMDEAGVEQTFRPARLREPTTSGSVALSDV
jgi:hypothetical protein